MRDILIQARALIAERGLANGEFVTGGNIHDLIDGDRALRPGDCFCTAGAIYYVQRDFNEEDPVEFLATFLPSDFEPDEDGPQRVYHFNDAHADNPDVILALFDKAIEAASC